jgi:lipopolysaccharide/colanic/teichoic acid biosynthesis glycosyltransferase
MRWFDVVGALVGLAVFSPWLLALAVAILVDDGRPLFFRQERLGRGRRPFEILKLRTMRDGKVTRVGRWLRASGLDELPQFLNVLRGDIAVVGPRPLTQADVTRLGWDGTRCDFRWSVPPGITGLAQVYGARGARYSLRMDRIYARRRDAWVDVKLIALSFVINALGKRRVRRYLADHRKRRLRRLSTATTTEVLARPDRMGFNFNTFYKDKAPRVSRPAPGDDREHLDPQLRQLVPQVHGHRDGPRADCRRYRPDHRQRRL